MKNRRNALLYKKALKVIPGGVNSPVRAFKSVGGWPIFIQKAKGPYLWDEDGSCYIDYCLSWGPLIFGHADKEILSEVKKTMVKGTSYGISTRLEIQLAEMIAAAFDSIDKVRLVSSGTEAVMTAIRLARGFTGRDKIIKFIGCYHGHADPLLVSAGSGLTTFGTPSSPGVPRECARNTLLAPYNDADAVERLLTKYAGRVAAVIVEPVAGNMGVILPKTGFLQKLRTLCTKNSCLLIFDEVITGFRLCYGGAQTLYKVRPDLTTLGKIIGGGFPIGAVGGKAEIMDMLSPQGAVYQAGTLSGNPVCVAAGIAALNKLKIQNPYSKLDLLTQSLCSGISRILQAKGILHTINRIGSMFTLFFTEAQAADYDTACLSDTHRFAAYFRQMLSNGVYLPPSQFEANFLSTAHADKHIHKTLEAVDKLVL
ncbi:MAG TPA: glutamate-1-semialdehyde 2,1-aminomutase [Anaerohalosphaeraceae bacterium]|nr:glutamate-1-semialdehyde 2,1-aminomutase [Anaerohalosphaeraceae bacterium]